MDDPTRTLFSGSATERNAACNASVARAVEFNAFLQEHNLSGIEAGQAALDGTLVHEVLSAVPFEHERKAYGLTAQDKADYYGLVRDAQKQTGIELDNSEFWYCVNALQKRDDIIRFALSQAPNPDLSTLTLNADQERMFADVPLKDGTTERFSMLPDVHVTFLDGNKERWLVLLDYKSGYGAEHYQNAQFNKQLASGVAVTAMNHPDLTYALAALLKRHEVNDDDGEMPVAFFRPTEIEAAKQMLTDVLSESVPLVRAMQAANGKPDKALDAKLQAKENVGNHCMYCSGKMACQKLRTSMLQAANSVTADQEIIAATRQSVAQAGERINHSLNNNEPISDMDTSAIADTLTASKTATGLLGLYTQTKMEAEEITRQLIDRGVKLPGVELKPGNRTWKVRDAMIGEEGEVIPLDTSPNAVYERIARLNDEAAAQQLHLRGPVDPIGKDEFLGACAVVEPTRLRKFLSHRVGVPENALYEKVLTQLGDDNPVMITRNRPSVIVATPEGRASTAFVDMDAEKATKPRRGPKL